LKNRQHTSFSDHCSNVKISPFTSFILDALRMFSALGVVLAHLPITRVAPAAGWARPYGHLMVMCFFVLSGLLIASSVEGKKLSAERYAALRLGRLWSVAVPCLFFTLLLQVVGARINPEHFQIFDRGYAWARYGLTTFFLNEVWFTSSGPATNQPVWSLAYEAFYYAFFGIAVFVRPWSVKCLLLVGVMALMGPKILVLLPAWLIGVLAWKALHRRKVLMGLRWLIFGLFAFAFVLFVAINPAWPSGIASPPWSFSSSWVTDVVFGAIVAGAIVGIDLVWGERIPPAWLDTVIRRGAGVSFTLYLLHYPLMVFASGVLRYDHSNPWQVGAILLGVFAIVFAIGSWIEPQRKGWTTAILSLLERIKTGLRGVYREVWSGGT
jgi:peptidoglycan/LPS O-acetylase OafA/YrhL